MSESRYVPGYGTKYLLTSDGVLYNLRRSGQYRKVHVSSDGRVRLYKEGGKEVRRNLSAVMKQVWGAAPEEYSLARDQARERAEELTSALEEAAVSADEPWEDE